MNYREINFDGLVGPTHNYAGLSHGNLASESSQARLSNPRSAALQGLRKAQTLAARGFPQGILPPHERPSIESLESWGFTGPDRSSVLRQAARGDPLLLAAASSASAMWTANACTMAPSCDTSDGRAHFTPANLSANLHRSIEAPFTLRLLQSVFSDSSHFAVHPPLPGGESMADEGAANHNRLAGPSGNGLHLFVYGRSALHPQVQRPGRFPARQSLESVQALARLHRLDPAGVLFLRQSPNAIDAGVFHNDVISVGHADTFICHQEAFAGGRTDLDLLSMAFARFAGSPLRLIEVPASRVSLRETVRTYLFNSQLLSLPGGRLLLVTPRECGESPTVAPLLKEWLADPRNPVDEVLSVDLRESMRNGGGPACLRQRIILSDEEIAAMKGRLLLDDTLFQELDRWIRKYYRSELRPADLADPHLHEESCQALEALTRILQLPPLYPFQQ
ncbi:MAG: N-succinylarginine dihydrolase [Oceanipulchritudo sp.]